MTNPTALQMIVGWLARTVLVLVATFLVVIPAWLVLLVLMHFIHRPAITWHIEVWSVVAVWVLLVAAVWVAFFAT